jgi:hypothetical protein
MVELLGAVGGGSFVLASLIVGLRLLVLASRTRELPETMLGFGLFTMGAIGYPLMSAARLGVGLSDETRVSLGTIGLFLNWSGELALCTFNWRVFQPNAGWAGALTAALAVILGGLIVAQAAGPGLAPATMRNEGILHHGFLVVLGLPLLWGSIEAGTFHARLRRRDAIGLGDPVVTDRIRLWTVAMIAAFAINLATSMAALVLGLDLAATTVGALIIGPIGLVASGAMWLAFFAPASYHERVRARAAASRASLPAEG